MHDSVYLSGPITGLRYKEALTWRDYVRERLETAEIAVRDPLRGSKSFHSTRKIIKKDEYVVPELSDTALLQRDKLDITNCDIVFVNLLGAKHISVGTMIEIGMCYMLDKLVVLVMEEKGNIHDGPLVRPAGVRFSNLDRAVDFVIDSVR